MITQELDLNMVPGTVPPVINVSQYDAGARSFVFTLYNGATLFNGTVKSCRIEGIKPDGKGFSYKATYSNGKVIADCTEQMTAVAGNVLCEIRLQETDDKSLGTLNFTLCVEKSPINEDTDYSKTEIPALVDLARSHERAAANSANQASSSASQAANSAAHVDAIKADMQSHLDQIDQNTADISGLRSDVDTNASNINGLRRDLEANVNDLDTKISKNASDIRNLEVADQDLNTRITKNTDDISRLRTGIETNARNIKRIQDFIFKDTTGKLVVKQGGLQCLQGNLIVGGKIIDIDDLLRSSEFIKQIIAMINSDIGALTVEQGTLSTLQGHLIARNI